MPVQIDGSLGITSPLLTSTTDVKSSAGALNSTVGSVATLLQTVTPINNTGATVDVTLGVGQLAYMDYASAATMPLYIACGDNQLYEMWYCSVTEVLAAVNITSYIKPNNLAYGSVFTIRTVYGQGASVISSGIGSTPYMYIEDGVGMFGGHGFISTKTTQKKTMFMSASSSTTNSYAGLMYMYWQDTTTPWTSLGTIVPNSAWTGRIYVKRVM